MKKMISLLSLFSGVVFASTPVSLEQNVPKMYFSVFDASTPVLQDVGLQYSVSNKQHQLCWTAFNMPFQTNNQVVEIFKSPAKAHFSEPSGSVTVSKNKLIHTITTSIPSQNEEFLQRCWRFNKQDPLGKYQLDVKVNNITFETQTFELVK